MSAQSTPGERTDGGPTPANAGRSQYGALMEFLLTGRMRLVTLFSAVEAFLLVVAIALEFALDLSILAALFAAAAFTLLIAAVGLLVVWLAVKTFRTYA